MDRLGTFYSAVILTFAFAALSCLITLKTTTVPQTRRSKQSLSACGEFYCLALFLYEYGLFNENVFLPYAYLPTRMFALFKYQCVDSCNLRNTRNQVYF